MRDTENSANIESTTESVPYIVHEAALARVERLATKFFILCVIFFLALVGSNIGWLIYESQFEDTVTVTQETPDGNNNYIGRNGDITNGKTDDN